jgi:segregation and condensation protein A
LTDEAAAKPAKPNLRLVPATPPPLVAEAGAPAQTEMPFAVVEGEPITELPRDLYIPPYALEVFLEAFEGPLDLLLYLIRRQNLDILDIPIAEISRQYVQYIELMKEVQFELAGEYLVMAATLAEIKSRMLLPRSADGEEEEEDPRAELVRRLQEYERFKQAAGDIDALERLERDVLQASADVVERPVVTKLPDITLKELLVVFKEALERSTMFAHHHVRREPLSVRERMSTVLLRLQTERYIDFQRLFDPTEGRMGVTVTFLAILELVKESLVDIVQAEVFGPIHIRAAQAGPGPDEVSEDRVLTATDDQYNG